MKKFDMALMKDDFSNVFELHLDSGSVYKISDVRRIDTLAKDYRILAVTEAGNFNWYDDDGKSENGYCKLFIRDEKKIIDFSKLPSNVIVHTEEGTRHFAYIENKKSYVFVLGASFYTAPDTIEVKLVKIVEQPEFRVWFGGECPVPEGLMVELVLRDGCTLKTKDPSSKLWNHSGYDRDIIAYRIVDVVDGYSPFYQGKEF